MEKLLAQLKAVVIQTGKALLDGYADTARPANNTEMGTVGRRLDELVTGILKPVLAEIRPEARWAGKEQEAW